MFIVIIFYWFHLKREKNEISIYRNNPGQCLAQVLVGPSKQLKQIIPNEHNIVKNPNWLEANQLAIYKRGRGFELRATEKLTNPGSGQSEIRTRDRRILTRLPLGHAASTFLQ